MPSLTAKIEMIIFMQCLAPKQQHQQQTKKYILTGNKRKQHEDAEDGERGVNTTVVVAFIWHFTCCALMHNTRLNNRIVLFSVSHWFSYFPCQAAPSLSAKLSSVLV